MHRRFSLRRGCILLLGSCLLMGLGTWGMAGIFDRDSSDSKSKYKPGQNRSGIRIMGRRNRVQRPEPEATPTAPVRNQQVTTSQPRASTPTRTRRPGQKSAVQLEIEAMMQREGRPIPDAVHSMSRPMTETKHPAGAKPQPSRLPNLFGGSAKPAPKPTPPPVAAQPKPEKRGLLNRIFGRRSSEPEPTPPAATNPPQFRPAPVRNAPVVRQTPEVAPNTQPLPLAPPARPIDRRRVVSGTGIAGGAALKAKRPAPAVVVVTDTPRGGIASGLQVKRSQRVQPTAPVAQATPAPSPSPKRGGIVAGLNIPRITKEKPAPQTKPEPQPKATPAVVVSRRQSGGGLASGLAIKAKPATLVKPVTAPPAAAPEPEQIASTPPKRSGLLSGLQIKDSTLFGNQKNSTPEPTEPPKSLAVTEAKPIESTPETPTVQPAPPEEPKEEVVTIEPVEQAPPTVMLIQEDPIADAFTEPKAEPVQTAELNPTPRETTKQDEIERDEIDLDDPFSGLTLEEPDVPTPVAPEPLPTPKKVEVQVGETPKASSEQEANPEPQESLRDEKARLIADRKGWKGLKGFCPVALRDQRDLIDGNARYVAEHEGRRYLLSSPKALRTFEDDPSLYAPAAKGMDLVASMEADEEGTLDYAVWYRDRLYLFASSANLRTFIQRPKFYLAAAEDRSEEELAPAPALQPKPTPEPELTVTPKAEPTPIAVPEETPQSLPLIEPRTPVAPEMVVEPKPSSVPKPITEPAPLPIEPTIDIEPATVPEPMTRPEPQPFPTPEVSAPTATPDVKPIVVQEDLPPFIEPEVTTEPAPLPIDNPFETLPPTDLVPETQPESPSEPIVEPSVETFEMPLIPETPEYAPVPEAEETPIELLPETTVPADLPRSDLPRSDLPLDATIDPQPVPTLNPEPVGSEARVEKVVPVVPVSQPKRTPEPSVKKNAAETKTAEKPKQIARPQIRRPGRAIGLGSILPQTAVTAPQALPKTSPKPTAKDAKPQPKGSETPAASPFDPFEKPEVRDDEESLDLSMIRQRRASRIKK